MPQFPKPLHLPDQVLQLRAKRLQEVLVAAKFGVSIRLAVILIELIGIIFINSSSLFLDVISSMMDIATSLFLIFCIKLAQRPPDTNHPFGHGRYEPMGGLLLGIFLMVLGAAMCGLQCFRIIEGKGESFIHHWSWAFPAVAMVILEIAYRLMIRTARQQDSTALAADAIHYRIDSLTSLFATVALWVAGIWPAWASSIDHAGALVIALFMIVIGWIAAKENFHQLMDRTPDLEYFEKVRIAAFRAYGVEGTEKIRIQQYGPDAHVDIDIEVKPSMSVERAHKISQQVRLEIQKAWPSVRDVTVHIEPYYANDH